MLGTRMPKPIGVSGIFIEIIKSKIHQFISRNVRVRIVTYFVKSFKGILKSYRICFKTEEFAIGVVSTAKLMVFHFFLQNLKKHNLETTRFPKRLLKTCDKITSFI